MTTEQAAQHAAQETGYLYQVFGDFHFLRVRGESGVMTFRSAEDVLNWLADKYGDRVRPAERTGR